MMQLFENHINQKLPFLKDGNLLVAVSGGLDSVVLTHLCHSLQINFALAHCNFTLRGAESNADADFVYQLAEDLDLELFIENFETKKYAEQHKISIQMAARNLRYQWFQDLAEHLNFDFVLTAHHLDDNLETVLINFTRGTGLEGLIGIPEINDKLVRPLLPYSRTDLLAYAEQHNISWREDSSNKNTKYLRNKLRHDVIPVLKDINPQLLESFKNTQQHLQESQNIIMDAVQMVEKDVVEILDETIKFNIEKLKKLAHPRAYLYQLLKGYGFSQWDDIFNLLTSQSGKTCYSESYRLLKNRDYLLLTQLNEANSDIKYSISNGSKEIALDNGVLKFQLVEEMSQTNDSSIYVDKDLLKYPLLVRKWKKGDYFYPFGMTNKKKVSKYFKDEKLSLLEKEKAWLLCSNSKIVWIINQRADNRFKITKKTNQLLKISFYNEI